MARTFVSVLSGCLALLLAGGGILFLGWLLWWLWSRQQQEEEHTGVEIELDTAAVEPQAPAIRGMEEDALPPPEEEELLPEPEEEELLPEPPEEEPATEPGKLDEAVAVRADSVIELESPRPVPVMDIEGPGAPDDLRVIEGIGPRIAGVLNAGGIRTFQDLADAGVAEIEGILRDEDPRLLRLCKPDTWPEQAALAAAGDWDGLQALTDSLKGGRRV